MKSIRSFFLVATFVLAEGSSRYGNKDRKNFMVVARGSTFECAAILEYLFEISEINQPDFNTLIDNLEQISKMLSGLIQHMDRP